MSGFGIGGDRERACEEDVAFDMHAERQLERGKFLETERSKLRIAKVGETEASVVVRVELGREPGADADRIEEFDHRHMVEATLATIGEKLFP